MDNEVEGNEFVSSGLSCFFEPRSLAILGSFKENYFGGYVVVKSLLEAGYSGRIYPINPHTREVLGLKVYRTLKDIPEKVNLALVMINARSVPGVMRECGEKGVRGVIVIADGFAERDKEGARLQEEIIRISKEHGILLMGPNTAGIVNTANGLNPAPYEAGYYKLRKGPVAIISQTGMSNPQAVPYPDLRFGISKICDLGNKGGLDECDVLDYLAEDEKTGVISMYLESIRDGVRFLETCKRVTSKKPVLVIKAGRTREGALATASHTGSMAVDDAVFEAVCRQSGLLRLDRFEEIFEQPKVFALQPLPKGNRMGIITITGGVAVMCIDKGAEYGLTLATLSQGTFQMLEEIFPGAGKMPVDIGPMMAAVKDAFSFFPRILDGIMADENVDSLLNIIWANPSGDIVKNYLKAYEIVRGKYEKPLVTWVYGPDRQVLHETSNRLEDMGFPVFKEPEIGIRALGLALKYSRIKERLKSGHPERKR